MSHHVKTFMPKFWEAVRTGTKTQTVRPTPKRDIKPGDTISLRHWTEKPYRSKQGILEEGVITGVMPIFINSVGIHIGKTGSWHVVNMEDFAKADGFTSWEEMRDWFESTHSLPFKGILIQWELNPTTKP